MNYRLDKMLNRKCSEKPEPPLHIKTELMAIVAAESFYRSRKPYLRYAIVFASLLFISGSGTVFASQLAIPGNTLYGIKRVSEKAYVNMQFSEQARAAAQERLIGRRIDEAGRLADDESEEGKGNIDELENKLLDEAASACDAWIEAQENTFELAVAGAS